MFSNLDDDEKGVVTSDTLDGKQITHEVIPAIRKLHHQTLFTCTAKPDAFPTLMGGQCVNTQLCTAIFEELLPLMG